MSANNDPDFAPIATRIRDNVGRQGFMTHIGAELSELTRGTCTLAVDRRPELISDVQVQVGISVRYGEHGFLDRGIRRLPLHQDVPRDERAVVLLSRGLGPACPQQSLV